MLTNLNLYNFKAFQQLEHLGLKPITVLCGTNSCGKSSVLQSILLIKQTLESQDPNQTLLLNGRFVHLGAFDSVLYEKDIKRPLGIEMEFIVSSEELASRPSAQTFPVTMVLRDVLADDFFRQQDFSKMRFFVSMKLRFGHDREEPQRQPEYLKPVSIQMMELRIKGDLPGRGSSSTTKLRLLKQLDGLYAVEFENYNPDFLGKDQFSEALRIEFANLFPSKVEGSKPSKDAPSIVSRLQYAFYPFSWLLKELISRHTYLGPLREAPARRYIYEDAVLEIGLKGENAPYLYLTERSNQIRDHYFYDIKRDRFEKVDSVPLGAAVSRWLKLMGIEGFEPRRSAELVYVELDSALAPGTRVNISNVGFGVSQIFPIILEGLRMRKHESLLLEQPEIHLHPNVQMQMADYFISLALSGKQVIIETHSDHIINRLVRRVVEDETDTLGNLLAVYFVRPTTGGSVVEPVAIDPERGIVKWPVEFFDQTASEQERIMRAGLRKRMARRSPGSQKS